MESRARRARQIQEEVRKILWESWDPIGIRGYGPDDEYDSYVGGVYRLLADHATAEVITKHLLDLEVGILGMGSHSGVCERTRRVVQELQAIDIALP